MRDYPKDAQCLLTLKALLDHEHDYRTLSPDFIKDCVKAARKYYDDPRVVTPTEPLELQPGQIIAMHYANPDENEPWRFGVVNQYLTGVWNMWTFNLKFTREKKSDKRIPCGPNFRSYAIQHIVKPRIITGIPPETQPVNFNAFEQAFYDVIHKFKQGGTP